jgi:hypothetical protein
MFSLGYEQADWSHLAQDRVQWLAVIMVMTLQVSKKTGSILLAEHSLSSEEGLCSME